jgi:hypothetical protein
MTFSEQADEKLRSRFTPVNDADDAVDRTCAQLCIYSGEIQASKVTELMCLSPSRTVTKGEASAPNSRGLVRVRTLNGWFLSSEEHVQSKDLRRHLDWVVSQLQPHAEALRFLQQQPNVRMYVSCPWWARHGGGGPSLWPEQMRALADLNLECSIGFADYSDEALNSESSSGRPLQDGKAGGSPF